MVTCIIMYEVGGVRRRIGGVYVPHRTDRLEWSACEATWDGCDFLMGDFNAKHDDWYPNPRTGSMNITDCHGLWLTRFFDRYGLQVHPLVGFTFRNISVIDLFIGKSKTRVSYDGKAGLEHVAVIARLEVDEPVDMIRRRPSWRNIPVSDCDDIREHVDSAGRVRYGAGWGRFSLSRPRPYNGPGGLFWGGSPPRPHPGRVPAHSLDGALFLLTCFNRDPSGQWAGAGAGAGNPKKTRPAPGRSAGRGGELGRGPVFFGAPEAP